MRGAAAAFRQFFLSAIIVGGGGAAFFFRLRPMVYDMMIRLNLVKIQKNWGKKVMLKQEADICSNKPSSWKNHCREFLPRQPRSSLLIWKLVVGTACNSAPPHLLLDVNICLYKQSVNRNMTYRETPSITSIQLEKNKSIVCILQVATSINT